MDQTGVQTTVPNQTDLIECEALLFDLDGTLVDSLECVEYAWRLFCDMHKIDFEYLWPRIQGQRSMDSIKKFAPHLDAAAEAEALEEAECTCTDGLVPVKGAPELLSTLPSERWAIVTSGVPRLARHRLGIAGVPSPNVFITAHDVVQGKPAPEGYLKAASQLGFAPEKCIVFEDAPAGIRAGLAAGMKVIGIATTYDAKELQEAHLRVQNLEQVKVTLSPIGLRLTVTSIG